MSERDISSLTDVARLDRRVEAMEIVLINAIALLGEHNRDFVRDLVEAIPSGSLTNEIRNKLTQLEYELVGSD